MISGNGKIWFTENAQAAIGSVTKAGVVSEFLVGSNAGQTLGLTVGPDKNIWSVGYFSQPYYSPFVAYATSAGAVTQVSVAAPPGESLQCPEAIATGSDGALWIADYCASSIDRLLTNGTLTAAYFTPTANAGPLDMVTGPDGNLWFVETSISKIGKLVPSTGVITEYSLPPGATAPEFITSAFGGLWFTAVGYGGEITTKGVSTLFPSVIDVDEVTAGPDGNIWATIYAYGGELASFTTAGSPQSTVSVDAHVNGLVTGPDKNIWFTDSTNNSIDVYVFNPQTVTPTSIAFNMVGETQTFSASEGGSGTMLTVRSSNSKVASVAPAANPGEWTVTAVGGGSCTIKVADQDGNYTDIAVSVTTETFVVD